MDNLVAQLGQGRTDDVRPDIEKCIDNTIVDHCQRTFKGFQCFSKNNLQMIKSSVNWVVCQPNYQFANFREELMWIKIKRVQCTETRLSFNDNALSHIRFFLLKNDINFKWLSAVTSGQQNQIMNSFVVNLTQLDFNAWKYFFKNSIR